MGVVFYAALRKGGAANTWGFREPEQGKEKRCRFGASLSKQLVLCGMCFVVFVLYMLSVCF